MKPLDSPPEWIARLLRIAAAVLVGAAITVWVTPVNALGRNLVPVGCGSPASPATEELTDFVCRDLVGGAKGGAVALAIAAAVLLLLSEMIVPKLWERAWLRGVAVASVLAAPVLALSAASLATTVAASGADGTLIRCGTPLAPASDTISKRLCGQLAERDKTLALAGMGLAILTVIGGAYVAKGTGSDEDGPSGAAPGRASESDPEPTQESKSVPTTELTSSPDKGYLEGRS